MPLVETWLEIICARQLAIRKIMDMQPSYSQETDNNCYLVMVQQEDTQDSVKTPQFYVPHYHNQLTW